MKKHRIYINQKYLKIIKKAEIAEEKNTYEYFVAKWNKTLILETYLNLEEFTRLEISKNIDIENNAENLIKIPNEFIRCNERRKINEFPLNIRNNYSFAHEKKPSLNISNEINDLKKYLMERLDALERLILEKRENIRPRVSLNKKGFKRVSVLLNEKKLTLNTKEAKEFEIANWTLITIISKREKTITVITRAPLLRAQRMHFYIDEKTISLPSFTISDQDNQICVGKLPKEDQRKLRQLWQEDSEKNKQN